MNVLVTGGTGTLGRHVVALLRQSGHRARIFCRHPRGHVDAVQGDLKTGAGLERALQGMDAIVHAATGARDSLSSRATDVDGTRRLLDGARKAHIKHIVYPSIVGMEGIGYPYYRTKLRAEALIKDGGVPWSILRATQFHELMEVFLGIFSRVPGVTMIPFEWQFQPVGSGEVARRIVDAVLEEPRQTLPDFGGPEIRNFKSLAESWLGARDERRRLVNLKLPMKFSRQWSEGKLLAPDHRDGKITFEQYLAERYPRP
ncbi:MAG TPA: NAD(P)H-binding protein [Candidatus Dormibacteraeota bacterium]|nr:NAD(P)H-binding protein [Candidatus Dormibacteraeota bacterium]